jgi:glutamine synthetase
VSRAALTLDGLRDLAERREVSTVIAGTPDPYGRLVGKRLTAGSFLRLAADGPGVSASTFVFGADLELEPLELAVSNASNGYRDFRLVPDFPTMRRVPWEPGSVLVLCDALEMDSDDLIDVAPRSILRRQTERAAAAGFRFMFASELEFYLANASPKQAWDRRYQGLPMLSDYRNDYQILQGGRVEWFISQIRSHLSDFGVPIESSKPEYGLGQQEVTLDYSHTLEMADRHVLFKYAVKELAARANLTVTFMAKPRIDDVGSSCHLHVSLRSLDGQPLSADPADPARMSAEFGGFVAGQLDHAADLGVLFAPTVNSYKRFLPEQFAGTAIAVGVDNRSCAFRLVGHGASFRVENRIPGADVNPYHAYAATIAAGLDGIERRLARPGIYAGNAWGDGSLPTMTSSLHRSADLFAESKLARAAFGESVYDHLLGTCQAELRAFDSGCVTDWELVRYYERI